MLKDSQTTNDRSHYRWKMIHFLDVEMDIARQDENAIRLGELRDIYKYIERNEYGADYMEKKYGE